MYEDSIRHEAEDILASPHHLSTILRMESDKEFSAYTYIHDLAVSNSDGQDSFPHWGDDVTGFVYDVIERAGKLAGHGRGKDREKIQAAIIELWAEANQ